MHKRKIMIFSVIIAMFIIPLFSAAPIAKAIAHIQINLIQNVPIIDDVADNIIKDAAKTKTAKSTRATGTGETYVPSGAIPLTGIFGSVNASGSSTGSGLIEHNQTTIDKPNDNGGKPYTEISLKGSNNWLSIWSKLQYKMDFSKSFTGKTYINFGASTDPKDGFTFTMQNDPKGVTALTGSQASTDGQNLGVYGSPGVTNSSIEQNNYNSTTPESKAIKNSVSIEFDLKDNSPVNNPNPISNFYFTGTDGPSYYAPQSTFDGNNVSGINGVGQVTGSVPHMATTYPGDFVAGYSPLQGGSNLGQTTWSIFQDTDVGLNAVVNHYNPTSIGQNVISSNVQDSTWYEFVYTFTPNKTNEDAGVFTYQLVNTKNGAKTAAVTIKYDVLKKELGLTSTNKKAYWGFTGANGKNSGSTSFIFTQVPVDLNGTLQNKVLQGGADKTNSDATYTIGRPAVKPGTNATFESDFTYTDADPSNPQPIQTSLSWTSTIDATTFDTSKITNSYVSINGTKIASSNYTIKADANKNIVIQLTSSYLTANPIKSGTKIIFSYDLPFLSTFKYTAPVKKEMKSTIVAQSNSGTQPVTFISNAAPFWIASSEAPKIANLKTYNLNDSPFAEKGDNDTNKAFIDDEDKIGFQFNYGDTDSTGLVYKAYLVTTGSDGKTVDTLIKQDSLTNVIGSGTPNTSAFISLEDDSLGYSVNIDLLDKSIKRAKLGKNTLKIVVTDGDEASRGGIKDSQTMSIPFYVKGIVKWVSVSPSYNWAINRATLKKDTTVYNRLETMTLRYRDTTKASSTYPGLGAPDPNNKVYFSVGSQSERPLQEGNFYWRQSTSSGDVLIRPNTPMTGVVANQDNTFAKSAGLMLGASLYTVDLHSDQTEYTGTVTWTISNGL